MIPDSRQLDLILELVMPQHLSRNGVLPGVLDQRRLLLGDGVGTDSNHAGSEETLELDDVFGRDGRGDDDVGEETIGGGG